MKQRQARTRFSGRRGARGFALLEALIAFLILSMGILGVVGLQATMAKAATSAKSRADAAYLAQQVIGVAWADRTNLAKYDSANCSTYAPCADWKAKVEGTLPAGATTVAVNAGTGQMQVQLNWTPPNEAMHTFATVTTVTP